MVVEGERPGADKGVLWVALLLLSFIGANGALLIRSFRRKPRVP